MSVNGPPVAKLPDRSVMELALEEARRAMDLGEVPVGAVVTGPEGNVVARACNRTVADRDPTAHAEVLALREAGRRLGSERLIGATLFATVEPCCMCAGAMVWARVARIVYGAADPKGGAVESLYRIGSDERLNHRVAVTGGVLAEECRALMQRFFLERRGGNPR